MAGLKVIIEGRTGELELILASDWVDRALAFQKRPLLSFLPWSSIRLVVLGHRMGLDIVEVVMRCEVTFGVTLEDWRLQEMLTEACRFAHGQPLGRVRSKRI